ncbi:aspartoacylase [Planctomycetes bacterium Poly30]|uniref:Aspartoacylase n=1 Tax=Saltatorellus ferox TaxID=2528018 RepID=A0A518EUH9_9BACT|nr:aspartoacylase [Planctomycetes bacterium Poly30]
MTPSDFSSEPLAAGDPAGGIRTEAYTGAYYPDLDGLQRQIGIKDDGRPGPLVLITAGMHGNEPAGVRAVREVLESLRNTPTGGRIVALAGNLGAIRRGVRHQGQDLNRLWTAENLQPLGGRAPEDDTPDERELRALFSTIEAERDAARAKAQRVVLIDLHSTSADGGAFSVVPDSIPSRRLARDIGLPAILGLEERIEGPLLTWLVSQGDTATVIEGGQHDAPRTQEVLRDGLWVALSHVGVLPEHDERVDRARVLMRASCDDVPEVLDLVYAHVIDGETGFQMDAGWSNFMPVQLGQGLAREHGQPVTAPIAGYMLMPLYQGLGTEGFFLCRKVGGAWLLASRILRRSWFEHMLRLLPGVKALDTRAGHVTARRGASTLTTGLLHLFGYRKHAPTGETTVWTRRPQ